MADKASLEKLARFQERDDLDLVLAATERRLTRRQRVRRTAISCTVLVAIATTWLTLDLPTQPRSVEVASQPADSTAAAPCPEGAEMTDRRTVAAIATATALLAGCTETAGDDPAGTADSATAAAPAAWDGTVTGYWVETAQATITIDGPTLAREVDLHWQGSLPLQANEADMREAWGSSGTPPPELRLEDSNTRVILRWDTDTDTVDPSDVRPQLLIDRYQFIPGAEDCTSDIANAGEFLLQGTITCTDLEGIRGGSDERPTIDKIEIELTYAMVPCELRSERRCEPINS